MSAIVETAPARAAPSGPRVCVIGAGPCGLTALKNAREVGLTDVVCYDESDAIGGNWVFSERADRMSVYETTHLISSRRLSAFEDFPMPESYPDYPSHRQMLDYFRDYAAHYDLKPLIRLETHVRRAVRRKDGAWALTVEHGGEVREEVFDHLVVCSGHHREPFIPEYPGTFAGETLHSSAYKRADPFRGKRVLVVGAGNSACDIAVDIGRVGEASISIRHGAYIVPKIAFGRPIDVLYDRARRQLPRFMLQTLFRAMLRVTVGPYEKFGLQAPRGGPFEMHPTLNTNFLSALRDGVVRPRVGIERLDGDRVRFTDGADDVFDTIVWATGFRMVFPFLDQTVIDWDTTRRPPLYLKMMHGRIPNVFFIGLFQPIGCIWRLADHQARIAALQIAGRLRRRADIAARIEKEVREPHWSFENTPRHAIEVDYHDFRRELFDELAQAKDIAPPRAA